MNKESLHSGKPVVVWKVKGERWIFWMDGTSTIIPKELVKQNDRLVGK